MGCYYSFFLSYQVLREPLKEITLSELSVNFRSGLKIPKPTRILNAGEWYLLDHISSGLVSFNHSSQSYEPVIADHWESESPLIHRFYLKQNFKFNDGTLVTSKDVSASIKNQLVAKSSTHFSLWEYLVDCDHLSSISNQCDGIQIIDDFTIEFRFQKPMTSFYLQLASPETGIWAEKDILDGEKGEFLPTKFSGPYYFDYAQSKDNDHIVLKRNEQSPISQQYPKAPKTIKSYNLTRTRAIEYFNEKKLGLFLDYYQPFPEAVVSRKDFKIHKSTPTMMNYLRAVSDTPLKKLGNDFIQKLWDSNDDEEMIPAFYFLPPGVPYNLSKNDFIKSLPPDSSSEIKIGYISSFHTKELTLSLTSIARELNINLEFIEINFDQLLSYFQRSKTDDLDFLLAPYAASERFPSVQLRFLTSPLKTISPIFDLKEVEGPNLDPSKIEKLRSYQKWLLENQLAVPLYFTKTEIYYDEKLDIGQQPKTDAEIELWRISYK